MGFVLAWTLVIPLPGQTAGAEQRAAGCRGSPGCQLCQLCQLCAGQGCGVPGQPGVPAVPAVPAVRGAGLRGAGAARGASCARGRAAGGPGPGCAPPRLRELLLLLLPPLPLPLPLPRLVRRGRCSGAGAGAGAAPCAGPGLGRNAPVPPPPAAPALGAAEARLGSARCPPRRGLRARRRRGQLAGKFGQLARPRGGHSGAAGAAGAERAAGGTPAAATGRVPGRDGRQAAAGTPRRSRAGRAAPRPRSAAARPRSAPGPAPPRRRLTALRDRSGIAPGSLRAAPGCSGLLRAAPGSLRAAPASPGRARVPGRTAQDGDSPFQFLPPCLIRRYVPLLVWFINPASEKEGSVAQQVALAGGVSLGCTSKGRRHLQKQRRDAKLSSKMTLMPGENSDYDYSALSCTSDASFNHTFFPESETLKGVFYQRARLIHPQEDLLKGFHPDDRKRHIIINVGGIKYLLPWTTLDEFPLTRLGQLKFCTNFDDILNICDDYDVTCNEFFFDRNPGAFRTILTFLRVGKLRLLREMCALSFQEELLYWGIEEDNLDWCCKRRYLQKMEELTEINEREDDLLENETTGETVEETKIGLCMKKLQDMVERPQSGLPGKVFACLSVLFVTITAVNLSISTMPDLREEEEKGECSQMCYNIFIVESVCVAWFSLEFLLRFIQARSKFSFLRRPLTLIDIIAILPYYITLLVDTGSEGSKKPSSGNIYLDKVGLVLRILRALRILYVMRLARHSLGLQTLGLTARRCTREFGLLLLFLCVAIALFAPLLYVIENEMADSQEFTSIPACYWWAVITMTTVGYGDMVPRSIPGQVVALSSILSGILLMAFPVTSIFHTFSRSYLELKQEQERIMYRRAQFLLKAKSQMSNESQGSEVLFTTLSTEARDNE